MMQSENEIEKILNENLLKHISKQLYVNFFEAPYHYSLFPAGKLFRPKMCWASATDYHKDFDNNSKLIASFTEIHHTYTLIHDDLPCMDNDDMRRGRASSHKKFSEWEALLCGDGLLNASYAILSNLDTPNLSKVLKYATWALGPKGLILGQALDLSGKMNDSFNNLILTHKLKTARLIQCCLVLPYMAKKQQLTVVDFKVIKKLHKLGEHMGVVFQLLDDLCELTESKLSEHEAFVNPWPKNSSQCLNQVEYSFNYIIEFFNKNESGNIKNIFKSYVSKIQRELLNSTMIIESHIGAELTPVIRAFDRFDSR